MTEPVERPLHVLPLAARSPRALAELAGLYARALGESPASFANICHTAGVARTAFEDRLALVAADARDARDKLAAFAAGATPQAIVRGRADGAPKIAFMFTGQGSQWSGMGKALYDTHPAFRATLDECARIVGDALARPLLDMMFDPACGELLGQAANTQVALFALEFALWTLWRSWGITPAVLVGHSAGEYVAACAAGVFSLEDGLRLMVERGRLMQALAEGEMASVAAPLAAVAAAVAPHAARASVAAHNGKEQVVSGHADAVRAICAAFETEGHLSRKLAVTRAFHSPLVDPILGDLERLLAGMQLRAPELPIVANLTGEPAGAELATARYWCDQARGAVHFAEAMRVLEDKQIDLFLELGPQPTLAAMGAGCVKPGFGEWLPSLRRGRDAWATMLGALGRLYVRGARIDWREVDRPYSRSRVAIPVYPWQRERYWMDEPRRRSPRKLHPMLPEATPLATAEPAHVWEVSFDSPELAYLQDHLVNETVILPATGFIELALAASRHCLGDGARAIEELALHEALVLVPGQPCTVQVVMAREGSGYAFRVATHIDGTWKRHVTAKLRMHAAPPPPDEPLAPPPGLGKLEAAAFYELLSTKVKLNYGPAFLGVRELWTAPGEVVAAIQLARSAGAPRGYEVHPALLDACLQTAFALAPLAEGVTVPTSIDAVRFHASPGAAVRVHARLRAGEPPTAHGGVADLVVSGDNGRVLVEVDGFRWRRFGTGAAGDTSFLVTEWRPTELAAPAAAPRGRWLLLSDRGSCGAALRARLEAGPADVAEVHVADVEVTSPAAFDAVLQRHAPERIVYLWALDTPGDAMTVHSVQDAYVREAAALLHLVKALGRRGGELPRLAFVTRGAQAVGPSSEVTSPLGAIAIGFGRTLANELPGLGCMRIDLDPAGDAGETLALVSELLAGDAEEIAYRAGRRLEARRVRAPRPVVEPTERVAISGRPFRLEADGVLREVERVAPAAGCLDIEATSIAFDRDRAEAGGAPRAASDGDAPPSYVLACGGRIATTGTGVDAFEPGGHVVAFATAAFGSHVVAASSAAAPARGRGVIPALVAAAPPYVAAHLALFGSAVLTRGERIVVRATKQGIGVAAAAWARLRGAEVYVACAGADTASIIAAGGHPLAAGTTAELVGEVVRLTAGRGVDVVLDEADDADLLEEAPKLLRQRGRFVHVSLGGPRIQARIPQGSRDLVFAFTNLATSIRENPSELGPILRELVARVEAGDLLLPVPAVASLAAVEAAGDAASGGWTVVRLDEPGATASARFRGAIRGDASYLITGGLGGLGLSAAAWMVARGARTLVLVGRRGATSDAQRAALAELERAGARVLVASADVCSRRDVDDLVRRIERELPPLRGVIHAAGLVPKISPFVELELADLTEVLGPKVVGTWHVHEATRAATLDFFVLYSSVAAWIGSKEFASYPAANAFLDAFGHYRRGQGVAGTSIAWGPFAEAGMALPFAERWERVVGLRSMARAEGVEILEQILRADVTDVCAVRLDVARVVEALPAFKTSKLWSDVVEGATAGQRTRSQQAGELVAALRAAAPDARLGLVEQVVQQQVATVLRAEADEIKPNRSLRTQGMDSLTWLELRQRVESALEVTLPVELFMKDPTPSSLAAELHARSSASK